jgi:dihydrolipoamide dehydrogenase
VALMIRAQIPVDVARDVVHPFPTFGEVLEVPLWDLAGRLTGGHTRGSVPRHARVESGE